MRVPRPLYDYRKRMVAAGYDAIATAYTEWAIGTRQEERARYTKFIERTLDKGAKILDLGCGTGSPTTAILAHQFQVTGVDISQQSIKIASKSIPQARFVHADMTQLCLTPESFDAIIAFYSVLHVPSCEQKELYTSVFEWLRPGGWLVATTGTNQEELYKDDWLGAKMYWGSFGDNGISKMLRSIGYLVRSIKIETFPEDDMPVSFRWIIAQKPLDPKIHTLPLQ